jgi:hypothetical protein
MTLMAWIAPGSPLEAVAVAGRDGVGDLLSEHVIGRPDVRVDRVEPWTVVRAEDLPWIDGVVYLGALLGAPGLLVPTVRIPAVPADLLMAGVRRMVGADSGPCVLLPGDQGVDVIVLSS